MRHPRWQVTVGILCVAGVTACRTRPYEELFPAAPADLVTAPDLVDAALPPPDLAIPPDLSGCQVRPEVCDGVDNDCNGKLDDVDRGHDGIPDCLRIGLLGEPGGNSASDFLAWLQTNGASVTRTQTDGAPLTAELLARFDLVILDRLTRGYSPAEAAILKTWVEAGGGLMAMSGYFGIPADTDNPNSLLSPLGLEYLPGLLNQVVTDFTSHPTNTGLTAIVFKGGYQVTRTPAAATAAVTLFTARLPEGPVAAAQERGKGRVFVWGDEWVEFDSEWRNSPEIRMFWVDVLRWLGKFS